MKPLVGEVLQAARIAELREAVGVSPNPDRELTHDEQRLVAWFKEALQAEMEAQRAENDAMLDVKGHLFSGEFCKAFPPCGQYIAASNF
jgi:hypothetical protein